MQLLNELSDSLGGAIALVSGRSIESLDRLFAPFRSAAVGLHGIEIRTAPDQPVRRLDVAPAPAPLRASIDRIIRRFGSSFAEDKGFGVAVHHRLLNDGAEVLHREVRQAVSPYADRWTVMRGRQVVEVKPAEATKARGCDALLASVPFAGTHPVAFGDDITDLDMFESVKRHHGTTIAVGPRITGAGDLRIASPRHSLALLQTIRDERRAGHSTATLLQSLRAAAR